MRTKIRKWGRSQGIRLSMHVLETLRLAVGDELEVIAGVNEIIVCKPRPKKCNFAELIAALPRDYYGGELPAGAPGWCGLMNNSG
ncbi:MAG TPA: AbrB/MazE/SpoVT family DNA-binding domain-containing protein [Pirellulales bacterium]|nr:AbrB/MazE/SpoVT family DNA-binding domain-containing protein [Pirellulales bacterium]